MAKEKQTVRSAAITTKAYAIASAIADKRKKAGLSSSITAVISEAVIDKFQPETISPAG